MMTELRADARIHSEPLQASIELLGPFRVVVCGKVIPIVADSKPEQLLRLVALSRARRVRRELLLDSIWHGSEIGIAGQCLNTVTYQLNKRAHEVGYALGLIEHDSGYYALSKGTTTDIARFDVAYGEGMAARASADFDRATERFQHCVDLYRGDLCASTHLEEVIERERLRAAFLNALAWVAEQALQANRISEALACTYSLLRYDPCREDAHRMLMRCHARTGNRSQALRAYQLCCRILEHEFATAPEPETVELYDRLRLDMTAG